MNDPVPSLEWKITEHCNYACPYCHAPRKPGDVQGRSHSAPSAVDAVLDAISTLPGQWLVKVIGGEAALHPDFFRICKGITSFGHSFALTTNFSQPLGFYKKLADVCGDHFEYMTASLHLSQVQSIEGFMKKAAAFKSYKRPETEFRVMAVMIEGGLDALKDIETELAARGVRMQFGVMKNRGAFAAYSAGTEDYLSGRLIPGLTSLRGKNLFGAFCHAGDLFFRVAPNGDVERCYSMQPGWHLGNIPAGTFKRNKGPEPCLAAKCTCTVPANRNMIRFDQKAPLTDIAAALLRKTPKTAAPLAKRLWKKHWGRLKTFAFGGRP